MHRDQRIANDVAQFTMQLATVFNLIVINPLIVVYYTYALWRLNGGIGPLAIYAYFLLGAVINRAIMSPLLPSSSARCAARHSVCVACCLTTTPLCGGRGGRRCKRAISALRTSRAACTPSRPPFIGWCSC